MTACLTEAEVVNLPRRAGRKRRQKGRGCRRPRGETGKGDATEAAAASSLNCWWAIKLYQAVMVGRGSERQKEALGACSGR